ncbi:MAG: hypothetical protein K0R00_3912 [Herbinix sp.]|nr:hypothetical protein [Herbinix sp.]
MNGKIKSRKVVSIGIILGSFLILGIFILNIMLFNSQPDHIYMNASWTYRYADTSDLTNNSDCIAKITVKDNGIVGMTKGTNPDLIPNTTFTVEVTKAIYNCSKGDVLNIYMTGGSKDNNIFEIADDPLMKKGEQYIIFAKKNSDGTFTVLGGSQGRMQFKDGKINSLNIANELVKENSSSSIKIDNLEEDTFISEIQNYLANK